MKILRYAISGEFIKRFFQKGIKPSIEVLSEGSLPDTAQMVHSEFCGADDCYDFWFVCDTDGIELPEGGNLYSVKRRNLTIKLFREDAKIEKQTDNLSKE